MTSTNELKETDIDPSRSAEEVGSTRGLDVVFRDVDVVINNKHILRRVSGLARHGQMLAVMGPSGAGKSTLLNTIAGRQSTEAGSVTLSGSPITRQMRRKICYVVQSDIFFSNLTLRETLLFTAYLRLPDTMPKELKRKRVAEIIEILDLKKCQNTNMGGTFVPGLSGGEKKRASIGCELLTNPQILLLDEPTTGLDSAISYSLMSTLKSYVKRSKKTVVTTIHQPSSQIFYMFDTILLMADGEVAYFGKGNKIMEFFASVGLHSSLRYNPADFILERVKESEEIKQRLIEAAYKSRKDESWPVELRSEVIDDDVYNTEALTALTDVTQSESVTLQNGVNGLKPVNGEIITENGKHIARQTSTTGDSMDIDDFVVEGAKWQTSFWTQYSTLTQRSFIQARTRILSPRTFIQTIIVALIGGLVWFNLPRTEQTLNDRRGTVFFMSMYFCLNPVFDIIVSFPDERAVITKERASGAYRLSAYYFAKMTTESPLAIVLPTIFIMIVYWMSNLTRAPGPFFYMLLLLYLSVITAQSIGLLIGVMGFDLKPSITTASVVMLTMMMTGGFYQRNIQPWLAWIRYLSVINYSSSSMTKIEFLYGEPFQCNPPNTTAFEVCTSPNSTFTGKTYLEATQMREPLWFDIVMLFVLLIVLRTLAYVVLRFLRRPKGVR